MLISNSSSPTIFQEEDNINSNLLTAALPQNHNTDGLAIKLNRLKEKFDQEFIDNWNTNLKQFSIVLIKRIVPYCDKQNRKHKKSINKTETILKQQLQKEDYKEIKNTIRSNETATKKLLQQLKFKNFT